MPRQARLYSHKQVARSFPEMPLTPDFKPCYPLDTLAERSQFRISRNEQLFLHNATVELLMFCLGQGLGGLCVGGA